MEPRRLLLKSTSQRWIRLVVDVAKAVLEIVVGVVIHPEDDVAAAYGVVDVEPLWPGDEYSRRTTRLT
jgi:hypothetical protein